MLTLALTFALGLSPTMAGPPNVAVHGSAAPVDYTQSIFLTGPAAGAQCTNGAVTNDQAGAITVSRASSSYCQKADLSYVLIDANKLVVEADGLRVEPASTNRVAYSDAIDSNWTPTDAEVSDPAAQSGPFGSVNDIQTTSSGGYYESDSFTITGTSAVLSAWAQALGTTATLVLRDITAGANRCTITVESGTVFPTTMTGRQSCSASTTIVSGNTHVVRAYPGTASGSGAGFYVTGVQVEPGRTVKTSYIPTSGSAVTRAADAISMTVTDNSARGCAMATLKAANPASGERIFSKGSDMLALNAVSQIFSGDGTNTVFTGGGASDITGRAVVVRTQWTGSTISLSLDSGAATGSGSFDGAMGSGTTLYIGSNTGVAQFLHGWLKGIKVSTSATGGCT